MAAGRFARAWGLLLYCLPATAAAGPYAVVNGNSGFSGAARVIDLANNSVITPSPALTLNSVSGFDGVVSVAIAPDGSTVALGQNNQISILTLQANGNLLDTGSKISLSASPLDVAFTPDGASLLVGGNNLAAVYVYDTATWTLQKTIT